MSHSHSHHGHSHDHDHSHAPTVTSTNERKVLLSFVLIFTFMVVEALGGRPFPHQIDGDFLGETTRVELRHEREVLDLVLPVGHP